MFGGAIWDGGAQMSLCKDKNPGRKYMTGLNFHNGQKLVSTL